MALTITSANSVFMLAITGVYATPQQLMAFGVDEAFDTEAGETAEVVVGVDNYGVAGWRPRTFRQTVTLLASSPSFLIFENWIAAMDQINEVLYASAIVSIPAIARKYTFPQGALTRYPPLPNVRRTLQQRQFEITWMPQGLGQPAVTSAPL